MYDLLDRLGGYLPPGTLGPSDLTPILSRILRINGSPLLDIQLLRDPTSSRRFSVLVEPPEAPSLPRPPLENLLNGFLPQGMSATQKAKEEQTISMFIAMLERIHLKEKGPGGVSMIGRSPGAYNVSRMQVLYPLVKWCNLFEEVLSWNCTDPSGEEDIAYISSSKYFTELNSMVGRFPKRIIHNAILLLYARDNLHELLNRTNQEAPFCTRLTSNLFGRAVGALYVRQYPIKYISGLERRTDSLFWSLKTSLASRIKAALWLDAESQAAALDKLDKVKPMFVSRPSNTVNHTNPLEEVSGYVSVLNCV